MGRILASLVIFVTFLGMTGLRSDLSVRAQDQGGGWTAFTDISNTPTASTYPCIVADSSGNVHVLWSEDVGGKTRSISFGADGAPALDARGKVINTLTDSGNTLYYARWDGKGWSQPVDVQINVRGLVEYPQAAVDVHGELHVIWVATEGQNANLLYSHVPADKAGLASNWSTPAILAVSVLYAYYPADIVADRSGGLHVIYSQIGPDPGAYVINSYDGGITWSAPIELYATFDTAGRQDGVSPVRMLGDSAGRLHAMWSVYGPDGNGKVILYTQSRDGGRTWSKPFAASVWQPGMYEVDWLTAGVSGDEIHLVWEGNERVAALYERISRDGGSTWDEPHRILTSLVGENGYADLVTDSAGHLHQLVVKRGDPDSLTNGIWYTSWQNNRWLDPILAGTAYDALYSMLNTITAASLKEMLQGTLTGNGLRYQRSVIVNGNELFVVVVNEWDGEIYSSHTVLSAPRIESKPYPAAPAATLAPATAAATSGLPTALPIAPVSQSLSVNRNETGDPILISSLAVMALVAVILARIVIGHIKKS